MEWLFDKAKKGESLLAERPSVARVGGVTTLVEKDISDLTIPDDFLGPIEDEFEASVVDDVEETCYNATFEDQFQDDVNRFQDEENETEAVKTVASTIAKGTFNKRAMVFASNVLPVPVSPTIMMLLFSISTSSFCCFCVMRL